MGLIIRRIIAILNVPSALVFLVGSADLFANRQIGEGFLCLLIAAINVAFVFLCLKTPSRSKLTKKSTGTDITDITQLCNLHESGKITDEEFAELKSKIIRG